MSNKTSDKNVGSIDEKAVNDDIELIKNLIENNKIEIKNVSVGQEFRLLRTLQNILAEREQDKKRIQELEKALLKVKDKNTTLFITCRNSIPKQAVIDTINENGFEVYTREYGNIEVVSIDVLQELLGGEK